MPRSIVLGFLLVSGTLLLALNAAPSSGQQPAPMVVEVEKLNDNPFVLRGTGGGNTAVFVTASGVVVVDTKNPGWGQPILDKIKTLIRQGHADADLQGPVVARQRHRPHRAVLLRARAHQRRRMGRVP